MGPSGATHWNHACIWRWTGPGSRCAGRGRRASPERGRTGAPGPAGEAGRRVHRRGPGPGDRRGAEDRDSEPVGCLTGSAAARSGGREPSAFAARPGGEARRRGLPEAGEPVVIPDGADWTPGTRGEPFGGGGVTFVLDRFHALEHPSAAGRAVHPEGPERDRRSAEVRADTGAGRAGRVIRELEPHRDRHGEVDACRRHFRNNPGRMRYGEHRDRGIQVGSGVVEGGCRRSGPRMKRSGTRWSERGANAMPALKGCVMGHRLADFLDWRANQAVAA